MALPLNIEHPTKTITLPVSGKSVRIRPFLVKEEKIILMLKETDDLRIEDVIDAISDMIRSCTFGTAEPEQMCAADFDYLFVNIRALSKGANSTVGYRCLAPVKGEDGETHECGHINEYEINLETAEVSPREEYSKSLPVFGTEYVVHFKEPTISTTKILSNLLQERGDRLTENEVISEMFVDCLESVTRGDEIMLPESREEIESFRDMLPSTFFEEMEEKFIKAAPALRMTIDSKCASCGHEDKIELRGIDDFF